MVRIAPKSLQSLIELVSSGTGLKKYIIEEMSVKELQRNLKDIQDFESYYKQMMYYRNWILQEKIRVAKYGSIRYEDTLKCFKLEPLDKSVIQEYFTVHPEYKELHERMVGLIDNYESNNNLSLPAYMKSFTYIDKAIKYYLDPYYTTLVEFAVRKVDDRFKSICPLYYRMRCEAEEVTRLSDIYLQVYNGF